ncbi:MAG: glycosyltransferase family 4 protein [Candidatus Pacebacteria bacterium]|nr:glycosyltransferase family 4 protein [Candidatus Paceibacterota bacterium]
MKKLKIAQIAPLWETIPPKKYGGIEIMTDKITNELLKRGHQVTLFASGNSRTKAKLKSVFPKSLFEMKVDWYHRSQNLINVANAFKYADEFDVIHNHAGDNGLLFSEITKTPVLTTLHNVLPDSKQKNSDEYVTMKYFSRKTNFVSISFNQRTQTDLKLNFVDNIYNGINLKDFSFNQKPKNYFVWLGRIHHGKGLWNAINAAKISKEKLIIAGNITCETDEEYFQSVKSIIDGKQIKYIGEVDLKQKNKLLKNAKALLFPTIWEEPFGLVMTEAMACGTPVIGFNKGSVSEVVKDKKTGFVVKDDREMIKAIKKINQINRLECRKHVEDNFTIERMVDGYERVYEKVIIKSKKRN